MKSKMYTLVLPQKDSALSTLPVDRSVCHKRYFHTIGNDVFVHEEDVELSKKPPYSQVPYNVKLHDPESIALYND